MMKLRMLYIALSLISVVTLLHAENAPPAEAFRAIEPAMKPGRRITPYLRYQMDAAWRQDDLRRARLAAISSETDLLELQRELRRKLLDDIGGLPESKSPLNARITGTVKADGYRVEKLIFESLPGFHVTALLYLPEGSPGPMPAVLLPCGHSDIGKCYANYQRLSGRLAKRGYVVLCWDPVGQGERSQFWDESRGQSRYNRVCGEHAVIGNLAYLAGANLARWEIWDGIRALDYLLTRPEVDGGRISITGTSGGGCQAALIAALDERIGTAAPSCYITALPMRMNNRIFADPDSDPEQDLFRMVSDGIDHPGLLLLFYPRPVIVCSAVEDFFPIEGARKTVREIESVYRRLGRGERIAFTEGYHGHSYSETNQEAAFAFLDRFNRLPVRHSLDSVRVFEEKDLWCAKTGQVRLDFPDGVSLQELVREYYRERKDKVSLDLEDLYYGGYYPGIRDWPVAEYDGGEVPETAIAWEKAGSSTHDRIIIDRYVLRHGRYLAIPALCFHRKGGEKDPVQILFKRTGKPGREDWPEIKRIVDGGSRLLGFDFRALGENRLLYKVYSIDDPRLAEGELDEQYFSNLSGVLANYVYNSLLTGRPYLLQTIEDVEIVARFAGEVLASGREIGIGGMDRESTALAGWAAGILPGMRFIQGKDAPVLKWSALVEEMSEDWPIQFLLPGGAYTR